MRIRSWTVALALSACSGYVGPPSGAGGGPGVEPPGPPAGGAPPPSPGGTSPPPAAPCTPLPKVPQRLWRLSNAQYANAVRDLLALAEAPTVTGGGESAYGFFSKDDEVVSAPLAYSYAMAAEAAARQVQPPPCPPGMSADGCAVTFIRSFGARALRRPLTAAEMNDLLAVYRAGKPDGADSALQLVVEALLQAPSFVYRSELGGASPAGAITLTPYEVAAQLSFLFLDSGPDDGLWTAAGSGALASEDGVARQVDRLLALPRARQNLDRVVVDWFGARQVLASSKDTTRFPQFTDQLRHDLLTETEMFVDDVLWAQGGKLADLVQSSRTFVNRALARHYGLPYAGPASGDFVPATFPAGQRSGLLTAGSLMAAHAQAADTSIVHRGIFMRNDVLCLDPVPPPPDGLLGSPEVKDALARLPTERARSTYRLTTSLCAGCHHAIDTLGVLFEHYDPVGRYRDSDGTAPIDAASTLDLTPALSGPLDGAVALGQAIVSGGDAARCAARKILGLAVGHTIVEPASCEAAEVEQRFTAAGATVPALFRAVALSPALRVREEQR
jgi:hypothetical protein